MFLNALTLGGDLTGGILAAIMSLLVAFMFFAVLISIGVYVYLAFAYMTIGKRTSLKTPGLAWIPGIGPLLIAFQTAKMHWWPWLLLIGYIVPVVGIFTLIAFSVFSIIWHWKMFESVKRPGWWALLMLLPIVGFVMLGIAAWGKNKQA